MLLTCAALLMWAAIAVGANRQERVLTSLATAAPFVVFTLNWWTFRTYHVDDAGISYAYARNLAEGLGLRPFASAPPVEGFSNPAWTLLLAAAEFVGMRAPVASKVLQLALALGAIWLTRCAGRALGRSEPEANCTAGLVASNASFVVWSAAGLENALLALLLIGAIAAAVLPRMRHMLALFASVIVLSRPEGPALAVAVLLSYALISSGNRGRELGIAIAVASSALVAYELFRITYFSDLLPNPYYAKLSDPLGLRIRIGARYVRSALVDFGPGLLAAGCLGCLFEPRWRRVSVGVLLPIGMGIVFAVCSGGDWMMQWRFLSHFVPLLGLMIAPGFISALSLVARPVPRLQRHVHLLAMVALLGVSLGQVSHLRDFCDSPTLALQTIEEMGEIFRSVGPALCNEAKADVATPDIGGVLYLSNDVHVMDLAALIDRGAARHRLERGYWLARLQQEPRPQLVFVHGYWTYATNLTAPIIAEAGYRPLCPAPIPVEGVDNVDWERMFPPQLYVRANCHGVVPASARERLRSFCEGELFVRRAIVVPSMPDWRKAAEARRSPGGP